MNKKYKDLITKEWVKQFNQEQLLEILYGLACNLNVELYAKPEFNAEQMFEIRTGLEYGINVEIYAKKNLNHLQMKYIKLALLKKTAKERFLSSF